MDCFASLAMTPPTFPHTTLSSPAKAGDPVRRGLSVLSLLSLEYWGTRMRGGRQVCIRVLAARCARGLHYNSPSSKIEGAGKTGCSLHPRSRVPIAQLKRRTRAYRFSGNTPAFPAQWLYGLLRALPGERLFCLRCRRDAFASRQLNASTAAPEPHDFAVRVSHTRPSWRPRPSHLTARS